MVFVQISELAARLCQCSPRRAWIKDTTNQASLLGQRFCGKKVNLLLNHTKS